MRLNPDLVITRGRQMHRAISLSMINHASCGTVHADDWVRLCLRFLVLMKFVLNCIMFVASVGTVGSARVLQRGTPIISNNSLEHMLRILPHGQQR